MVQLLTQSDSNSIAADTLRTMYVQMLDIYRKYQKYRKNKKYRKYRKKSDIFDIFENITIFYNPEMQYQLINLYRLKRKYRFHFFKTEMYNFSA